MGCKRCGNTGYRGRIPVIEVAVITPALADMIAGGASAHALQRAAVAQGMASMRDVAIARVRRGETTLQEIERVVGENVREAQQEDDGPPAILVVNADPAWRRMARALLEGGGFRVSEAASAEQAVEMQQGGLEFALMVTDMTMPALPAPNAAQRGPALRPSQQMTMLPSAPEKKEEVVSAPQPSGDQAEAVDWSKFAASLQSSLRKTGGH